MKSRHLSLIGLCSLLIAVFVVMLSGSTLAKEVLRYNRTS